MGQVFHNYARAKLASGIAPGATSWTLDDGSVFPGANVGASAVSVQGGGDWYKVVLQDGDAYEIAYVRTHDAITTPNAMSNILRGQEGTSAQAFAAGAVVGLRPLASDAVYWTGKQNAEAGKGLSQEDYTTAEKGKLADLAALLSAPSLMTLNYTGGELTSVDFTQDGKPGTITLQRTSGVLTSVVTVFDGKTRTETLTYTSGALTSVTSTEI